VRRVVMTDLELAKKLIQIADSPDPKRACAEQAADLLIAAHQQNPSLTLRDLTHQLSAGEVWNGHDEDWIESLIRWRHHDLATS
jgi:hypothetical protein